MSSIDDVVGRNGRWAEGYDHGHLPSKPRLRLAVVCCMDCRLDVHALLGLQRGDAHVIRNAGGLVTDDVLRSLTVSQALAGTREVLIINHTDCGMAAFSDEQLRQRLVERTGVEAPSPDRFLTFSDVEANVREQVARVQAHPWAGAGGSVTVRGFVYDVANGRLREVAGEVAPGADGIAASPVR